ncbi:MAG TPA: 30S ribosomal protein S6 [Desulfotignum sp.]|jgi:small subunit ribosomal protein S6|nr:30S ribosomal protein S6 [Desulfotignum sp.]
MRKYETVIISEPDLQDQTRAELFDKIRNIIARENGILLSFDDWGSRKLAYEINRKLRGHYACLTYGGSGDLVKELERNLGLSDDVMKFMTILLATDQTAESLAQEARDAEAQKAAATAAQDAGPAAGDGTDAPETDRDAGQKESAPTAASDPETAADTQN